MSRYIIENTNRESLGAVQGDGPLYFYAACTPACGHEPRARVAKPQRIFGDAIQSKRDPLRGLLVTSLGMQGLSRIFL
jgi:hypothetical protein